MFLEETLNPTYLREHVDYFLPLLDPSRRISLCDKGGQRRDKRNAGRFAAKLHRSDCFRSHKVSSNRSKQGENIWMKDWWRQRRRGAGGHEAPPRPVRKNLRTFGQYARTLSSIPGWFFRCYFSGDARPVCLSVSASLPSIWKVSNIY